MSYEEADTNNPTGDPNVIEDYTPLTRLSIEDYTPITRLSLASHDTVHSRQSGPAPRMNVQEPDRSRGSDSADFANNNRHCIYKLTHENEKAFVPELVSIGPFYDGQEGLQAMMPVKALYVHCLIPRSLENVLETWLHIMRDLDKQAREYYSENLVLDSDNFAMLMLLDGCFLIALFRMKKGELTLNKDDPIFNMRWMMPALRRDLLVIGNQITFFVLKRLFNLINNIEQGGNQGSSLEQLALHFFNDSKPNHDMILKPDEDDEPLHILHLFYTSLIPEPWRKKSKKQYPTIKRIQCVTKLKDAGLKVRKGRGYGFLDIKFSHHGILEIPPIQVQDFTCSQFMNLIAFEQCYSDVPTLITAYALFMDCLINSPEDVRFLCENGIVENWLGNDEEVASLFNMMCRGSVIQTDECYLAQLFSDVDVYCNKSWHVWRESLKRDYFKNPWAIISVIAAIFLLILTVAQTVMAFVAYFIPHN